MGSELSAGTTVKSGACTGGDWRGPIRPRELERAKDLRERCDPPGGGMRTSRGCGHDCLMGGMGIWIPTSPVDCKVGIQVAFSLLLWVGMGIQALGGSVRGMLISVGAS